MRLGDGSAFFHPGRVGEGAGRAHYKEISGGRACCGLDPQIVIAGWKFFTAAVVQTVCS